MHPCGYMYASNTVLCRLRSYHVELYGLKDYCPVRRLYRGSDNGARWRLKMANVRNRKICGDVHQSRRRTLTSARRQVIYDNSQQHKSSLWIFLCLQSATLNHGVHTSL